MIGDSYFRTKLFPWKFLCYHCKAFFMHCFLNTIMNYHTLFSLYFNQWYPYIAKNYSVCDEDVLYVSLIIWFIVISKIWMLLNACSNFKYILYCLHWAFLDITYDGISQSQYLSFIFITYAVFFTVSNFECIILVKQTFLFNEALIKRTFCIRNFIRSSPKMELVNKSNLYYPFE